MVGVVKSVANPDEIFKQYHVKALFRFSPEFSADLRGREAPRRSRYSLTDRTRTSAPSSETRLNRFSRKARFRFSTFLSRQTITMRQTILYNPQQKSAMYFVPGLMVIILMMISAMLTSLTITREKEMGTLEQMLVSPIRRA